MRNFLLVLVTVTIAFVGCSSDFSNDGLSEPETGRVFGGPSRDDLFRPYQGRWAIENRTFDPPLKGGTISGGPDISINGQIIRFGSGTLVHELRLCQTRQANEGIECEAWHHEDISDPGDMQRAYCKLRMQDDKLVLHWRIVGDLDFSDDLIIATPDYVPPTHKPANDESPWWIETYVAKTSK